MMGGRFGRDDKGQRERDDQRGERHKRSEKGRASHGFLWSG